MQDDVKALRDADLLAWSKEQADALRAAAAAGSNLVPEWENLAEEIADWAPLSYRRCTARFGQSSRIY